MTSSAFSETSAATGPLGSARAVPTRRVVLAVAGPVGALMLTLATLIAVPGTDQLTDDSAANAALLAAVAGARNRAATAGLLMVLGLLTLIPFVCVVGSMAVRRGSALAIWGCGLAAAGLAGAAVVDSFWFSNVRMTDPSLDGSRDAMVHLLGLGAWPLAVFGVMVLCLPIGWFLPTAGLWWSRVVGRVLPLAMALGVALFLLLPDHLGAVGAGVLLVVTTLLARRIMERDPQQARAR